jgi:hypothetical protein
MALRMYRCRRFLREGSDRCLVSCILLHSKRKGRIQDGLDSLSTQLERMQRVQGCKSSLDEKLQVGTLHRIGCCECISRLKRRVTRLEVGFE